MGDGRHLLIVQTVGSITRHVVVCPASTGEEQVRHSILTEDTVVTHVTDIVIERGQEYGNKATQALASRIKGKQLTVEVAALNTG